MANPAAQTCATCGQSFPPAQMEITENGPRCFQCSQRAAIAQRHDNIAAQLAGHNRTVMATGGFRFWTLEFHCTHCNEKLDEGPGLFSFKPPPPTIACPKCGHAYVLSFWQRARWLYALIFKIAFLVVVAVRVPALRAAIPAGGTHVAAQLLLSFAIAGGAATVLAIPAALLTGRKKPAA